MESKPELCPDCGAELDQDGCPVCDPWLYDKFDDDLDWNDWDRYPYPPD